MKTAAARRAAAARRPPSMSPAAVRQRRHRRRQAANARGYWVTVPLHVVEALLKAQRLSEAESEDDRRVAVELVDVLVAWARRWL